MDSGAGSFAANDEQRRFSPVHLFRRRMVPGFSQNPRRYGVDQRAGLDSVELVEGETEVRSHSRSNHLRIERVNRVPRQHETRRTSRNGAPHQGAEIAGVPQLVRNDDQGCTRWLVNIGKTKDGENAGGRDGIRQFCEERRFDYVDGRGRSMAAYRLDVASCLLPCIGVQEYVPRHRADVKRVRDRPLTFDDKLPRFVA